MLICHIQKGSLIPRRGNLLPARDSILPIATLTPKFKGLDPIVQLRDILHFDRATAVRPGALNRVLLERS